MATSKSLRKAVKTEVKEAKRDADTGNEQTISQGPGTLRKAAGMSADLPTGTRRGQPPE
jgi:hypothetical protein